MYRCGAILARVDARGDTLIYRASLFAVMERMWITHGSTSLTPIVNTLNGACHESYLPTDIYLLENPGIEDVTDPATALMKTIVTASGGAEPAVTIESLDDELDFEGIVSYLTAAITTGKDADAEIAIDITPGRKFWSVISFRAGHEYNVDHLYYGHLLTDEYYGMPYPTIPRTAMNLIDFMEVL